MEKDRNGEAAVSFMWKGNNEEGEEKGRFVPSHGGEEAKALQRKNGMFSFVDHSIPCKCGRNMLRIGNECAESGKVSRQAAKVRERIVNLS